MAVEVPVQLIQKHRVCVLEEEEGLRDVGSVPVGPCTSLSAPNRVMSHRRDSPGALGQSRPAERSGTLCLGDLDRDNEAVEDKGPNEVQALGGRERKLQDGVYQRGHRERSACWRGRRLLIHMHTRSSLDLFFVVFGEAEKKLSGKLKKTVKDMSI